VFTENSIRAESTMISSACSHSPPEKLIEATVQQRCNGVLNGKAESARKNPVWAHGRLSFQRCVLPAICRSPWAKTRNEIIRVGVFSSSSQPVS
jgi:hypothetical protein